MKQEEEQWDELFDLVARAVSEWRRRHPRAKLTEIEEAIDEHLAKVRVQMVEDLAQQGETADLRRKSIRAARSVDGRWWPTGNRSGACEQTMSRRLSWSGAKRTVLTVE